MTTPNTLTPDALRDLFRSYFRAHYVKHLSRVIGVAPSTIKNWIHLNNRVRPVYLRRLAAYTPRAHKNIDDWCERRIARIRAWTARKHIELDEAQKTLLWAAEVAERNSRKPKENSSL